MPRTNKINIDKTLLEALCSYHASVPEITAILKVNHSALKKWVKSNYDMNWAEFYTLYSAKGKVKIRENQFKLSSKSPDMAKYLGDKHLKTEKPKREKVGRPRIWDKPEELQKTVDEYFKDRDQSSLPYTITGLTLALGFENRQSLLDYQNTDKFGSIIRRAKTRVESYYEEAQHSGQVVAGIIFGLKANFKWQDKVVTETQFLDKDGKPTDPTPPATIINKTYIQPK